MVYNDNVVFERVSWFSLWNFIQFHLIQNVFLKFPLNKEQSATVHLISFCRFVSEMSLMQICESIFKISRGFRVEVLHMATPKLKRRHRVGLRLGAPPHLPPMKHITFKVLPLTDTGCIPSTSCACLRISFKFSSYGWSPAGKCLHMR